MHRDAHPGMVLVVEDDVAVIAAVQEALQAEGYRVAVAADYAEAVDALTRVRFALVLVDAESASTPDPQADR